MVSFTAKINELDNRFRNNIDLDWAFCFGGETVLVCICSSCLVEVVQKPD